MKRSITNLITLVFLGFLIVGGICILQNLVQEVGKTFTSKPNTHHILAY